MVLEDQVAIVTGSGQGIGKAIALRFARAGADIAVVDANPETAAATGREVQRLGRRAVVRVADVSDFHDVDAAVNEIAAELGRIDVLVNNAGIEKRAPFLEITPDDWQRQLDVNLSGTFYWTQATARRMAKRAYGRIVNLSSVAGPHRAHRPCRLRSSESGHRGANPSRGSRSGRLRYHGERHRPSPHRDRAHAGRLERRSPARATPARSDPPIRHGR